MRQTLEFLVARGADDITAVCVVAAPEGIDALAASGLPVGWSPPSWTNG
jgi:uracil phosphoribosyltransferase